MVVLEHAQKKEKLEGIPIGFDVIKYGKTLLKLKDGNYIEIAVTPMKVLRHPTAMDPEGLPMYAVAVANPQVVFTKEQALKMLEEG